MADTIVQVRAEKTLVIVSGSELLSPLVSAADAARVGSEAAQVGAVAARTGAETAQAAAAAIVPTLAADLDGLPWLAAEALTLTGVAAGLAWNASLRQVATAIKSTDYDGSAVSGTETYYIGVFSHGDATFGDRIIVRRASDNVQVADTGTATVTKSASGPTRRVAGGSGYEFIFDIDYRDISTTGVIVNSGTKTPLMISRGIGKAHRNLAARSGFRARNIAFNPAALSTLSNPTVQGGGTMPSPAAANAALTARGVERSYAIGTGSTATALYKRDLLPNPARANGKYLYVSALVYSATGTNWPSGQLAVYLYDAATGGNSVSGVGQQASGFIQISANLRSYWTKLRLPTVGTLVAAAYGFDSLVAGSAAEVGGWTMAVSDGSIWPEMVAEDDWVGHSTRDSWRDGIDTSVAGLQANSLVNYPYFNLMPNGNFDPNGLTGTFLATPVYTAPTSAEFTLRNIKRATKMGSGGAQSWVSERVLDASASGQFYFASMYVYSADGVTWGAPAIYYYSGWPTLTQVAGIAMTSFVQISANVRLYYRTGQFTVRSDLSVVRLGTESSITGSGVNVEYGGFTFARHSAALSLTNTARDEWYGRNTRPETVANAVARNNYGTAGVAYFGDSITHDYGIPALLQNRIGATVHNLGFRGTRWGRTTTATAPTSYNNDMSMVAIAECIRTGNFTPLTDAAANYFTATGDDLRAQAAAVAALNWSAITHILCDYGTNDFASARAIGADNSALETDFRGSINLTVSRILATYPTIQLGFVTPQWRGPAATHGDSNINANGSGLYLADYQNEIAKAGRFHQVPVCRTHELIGINLTNRATYLSADDLHPTSSGASRKATRLGKWFQSVF
jgi:hypothetical protein